MTINSFIKEKGNKEIIENTIIKNNFKKAKEENYYVFNSFGSESFNEFYFKLIFSSQIGNIKSFHKLMDIKNYYENLKKCKKKIFSFEQNYAIFLISLIRQELDKFTLISNFKYYREFPLLLLETKQQINQLQILHNKSELDFEILKKLAISIEDRVDFEFRRKIGNIIADKIVDKYGKYIDKIELTEYLLELSIEDIEKKIIKVKTKNISDKDKNISLEELTKKYKEGLNLLKNLTTKKLKNNKKLKNENMPKVNNFIIFLDKPKNNKDIHIATILNLFFIIRKKLNEIYSNSIHNKPAMLNYFAKEILDKFGKEKGPQKIEEKESKSRKEKFQKKNEINISQNQTVNLQDEKGKEDFNVCKERKTIIIKKIFKIENDFLKKNLLKK